MTPDPLSSAQVYTINEAMKIKKKRNITALRALKVYMNDTFGIMQKNNKTHRGFSKIINTLSN